MKDYDLTFDYFKYEIHKDGELYGHYLDHYGVSDLNKISRKDRDLIILEVTGLIKFLKEFEGER